MASGAAPRFRHRWKLLHHPDRLPAGRLCAGAPREGPHLLAANREAQASKSAASPWVEPSGPARDLRGNSEVGAA